MVRGRRLETGDVQCEGRDIVCPGDRRHRRERPSVSRDRNPVCPGRPEGEPQQVTTRSNMAPPIIWIMGG